MSDTFSLLLFLAISLGLFGLVKAYVDNQRDEERQHSIREKYGNGFVADTIADRRICEGLSTWQVRESWGEPDKIERKVFKGRDRETWKYQTTNRTVRTIYFEDGVVTGWKE